MPVGPERLTGIPGCRAPPSIEIDRKTSADREAATRYPVQVNPAQKRIGGTEILRPNRTRRGQAERKNVVRLSNELSNG